MSRRGKEAATTREGCRKMQSRSRRFGRWRDKIPRPTYLLPSIRGREREAARITGGARSTRGTLPCPGALSAERGRGGSPARAGGGAARDPQRQKRRSRRGGARNGGAADSGAALAAARDQRNRGGA